MSIKKWSYKITNYGLAKYMKIGIAALKCCFAEKETGDVGAESVSVDRKVFER
ncbi:hypothetical protein QUF75_20620 [Desulfococcaceae bacterium HSG7]|nr:hypothetical protein [Desulfococcaceae bacterium HSG7]